LIISKVRNANLAAITINVTLLDVIQGGLGLVGISHAFFCKNRCTNLVLYQLEYLVVNLKVDVIQIHVGGP
jgi:hypothetical protein